MSRHIADPKLADTSASAPPEVPTESHEPSQDSGDLQPSRGIGLAVLISLPFWVLLAFVAYLLL